LAIRALDGSAACVGVPLKKAAAQLPTGLRRIGRVAATPPAPLPVAAAGGRLVGCALCGRCGIGCERPAFNAVGRAELGRDMLFSSPDQVVTTVSMPWSQHDAQRAGASTALLGSTPPNTTTKAKGGTTRGNRKI